MQEKFCRTRVLYNVLYFPFSHSNEDCLKDDIVEINIQPESIRYFADSLPSQSLDSY